MSTLDSVIKLCKEEEEFHKERIKELDLTDPWEYERLKGFIMGLTHVRVLFEKVKEQVQDE